MLDFFLLLFVVLSEFAKYTWTRDYDAFIRAVCEKSVRINIVFTKVVQSLVVRHAPNLTDVTTNIFPLSVYAPPSIKNVVYDPEILGSGMVSVVYSGTFTSVDGKVRVAVKVKRQHVDEEIRRGLSTIKTLVRIADALPVLHRVCWSTFLTEVEASLLDQLDFNVEVQNQHHFKSMFEFNSNIVVPRVFKHTNNYIMMDLLTSSRVRDGTMNDHYAKLFCTVVIKSTLLDGFIHTDLHAGNLLFLDDGKMGIIDFGLVLALTTQQKNDYVALSKALTEKDYEKAGEVTLAQYFAHRPGVVNNPTIAFDRLVSTYRKIDERNTHFGVRDVAIMIDELYPCGYQITPYFYKILLSMVASDTFLKTLSPSMNETLKKEVSRVLS